MNVIIAGSRGFHNAALVEETMAQLFPDELPAMVIQGEAYGADKLGKRWAQRHGVKVLSMPAEWDKYGKTAGLIRNHQMLRQLGPDGLLVAFWDGCSTGTSHMIWTARKQGVDTVVIPI